MASLTLLKKQFEQMSRNGGLQRCSSDAPATVPVPAHADSAVKPTAVLTHVDSGAKPTAVIGFFDATKEAI